ncbi:MAG: CoB--CoM heterodisulfide reductase iron-sulfur subunit A family protein [Promethearchaeota archaeon]
MEDEDVRIGIFVCHCGSNIGGVMDCKAIAEYAATLPNVVYAEDNLYTCSEVGLKQIKEAIKDHNLNRVIVASCTPRTHEALFRDTIREAGLNPYLFEMTNIRDQCSWVHTKEPEKATNKAKDLLKMAIGRAKLLEPLEKIEVGVTPAAVVIGGGIAGITAAANLANQGYKVFLLEKTNQLGGIINQLYKVYPSNELASNFIQKRINHIQNHPNIEVLTNTTIKNVSGFVGEFNLEIEVGSSLKKVKAGIIIIATGAQVLKTQDVQEFKGENVINQAELEGRLKNGTFSAKNVVMIQCAGARIPERPYCSNICCMTALKNALLIKEQSPDSEVTILYQDIQTLGTKYEETYQKARESRVMFVKYSPEKIPIIKDKHVQVYAELIGDEISIPRDLIVLSTPIVANPDSNELAQFFKVPLEENQFYLEAHMKLRPVDFATDGIYVCGCAKWPVDIPETISQAYAASSRASTILSHETFEVEGSTAKILDKRKCVGCEICIKICPFGAITKNEEDEVEIIQVLCHGCGICGASCPHKAITISHFTTEQIVSQIHSFGG